VPKGIDQGPHAAVPVAAAIDLLLLLLFAVQHTVMARPWFKRRWTRIVPEPAERATFVLAASLALALLFWLWLPVRETVWHLPGPGAAVLWAVYAGGWAVAVSSTFLISHSDLFGLRQAWLRARRAGYSPPPFTERSMYRRIRHPLMAGFLIVFWSAPTMTAGHLLFAATATGYILVGIAFEEHDLLQSLGETYAAYRARVPALIPRPSPRRCSPGSSRSEGTTGRGFTARGAAQLLRAPARYWASPSRSAPERPSGGWAAGQDDGGRVLLAGGGDVADGRALAGGKVGDHDVPERGLGGGGVAVDRGDHVAGGEPGAGGGAAGDHTGDRHAGARGRGAAGAETGSAAGAAGGALPDLDAEEGGGPDVDAGDGVAVEDLSGGVGGHADGDGEGVGCLLGGEAGGL
jgi:protein-S-isoprenylcysteine O-methyltransferase Ste14